MRLLYNHLFILIFFKINFLYHISQISFFIFLYYQAYIFLNFLKQFQLYNIFYHH